MEPIQFFQLASKQAEWLSVRQSVVSSNVANANTPGYKTRDVVPFQQVLEASAQGGQMTMVSTNPMHFGGTADPSGNIRQVKVESQTVTESGNNVSLAREMVKSSDIRQQYDLNTGLVKSINQMMLMAVRK